MADEENRRWSAKAALEAVATKVGTNQADVASVKDMVAEMEATMAVMAEDIEALKRRGPAIAKAPTPLKSGEVKALLQLDPTTKFRVLSNARMLGLRPGDELDPRSRVKDANHLASMVSGGLKLAAM